MGKHKPQFHLVLNLSLSLLLCLTAFESRLEQSVRNTTRRSSPAPTSSSSPTQKSTHFFRLFFLIGHTSPKNGILCIDVLLAGSFTLPQRAAMHLSGIFNDLNKSRLGKKRCDRPNWYKFLKLCHHTSRILSGWEETNANGGPKWRQISKILKKSCFVQSKNFFPEVPF